MNSRRHTITSLSIVLLAVTIMSVSAIGQNAYAGGAGMSLSADCSGSSCDISGTTDRSDQDATMVVTAPNGNIVTVGQLSTSGGSYSTSINVSNLDDGSYTVAVNQGSSSKYNLSVSVDVSDGSSDSSASVSNQIAASEEEAAASVASPVGGFTITAGGMEGSTTIDVSGTTDRSGDITLTVTAPNGNIVTVSQISPSGGSFATTIETGGPMWSQDGMYTIKAVQGAASSHQKTAQVEVIDGHVIPEFGVIAAMILAVAIVSIIVVTAKTKLSLVPRY
ncbi:PEFG-CTERM sorting domain-containing protein [Marine Group I thaumarchaeote]|uniref:PEFG-CTERM sorting domain-containing protein n=1 Tax=Marine Group I thaumarchaeote TaxID=2511932 RepID=A0A7K4NTN0_9ARCH|nr:PEFG-CTERM sorting domain-containing protein [Marine Group I thaumarchaeote]